VCSAYTRLQQQSQNGFRGTRSPDSFHDSGSGWKDDSEGSDVGGGSVEGDANLDSVRWRNEEWILPLGDKRIGSRIGNMKNGNGMEVNVMVCRRCCDVDADGDEE
jgi:hypothetical protein